MQRKRLQKNTQYEICPKQFFTDIKNELSDIRKDCNKILSNDNIFGSLSKTPKKYTYSSKLEYLHNSQKINKEHISQQQTIKYQKIISKLQDKLLHQSIKIKKYQKQLNEEISKNNPLYQNYYESQSTKDLQIFNLKEQIGYYKSQQHKLQTISNSKISNLIEQNTKLKQTNKNLQEQINFKNGNLYNQQIRSLNHKVQIFSETIRKLKRNEQFYQQKLQNISAPEFKVQQYQQLQEKFLRKQYQLQQKIKQTNKLENCIRQLKVYFKQKQQLYQIEIKKITAQYLSIKTKDKSTNQYDFRQNHLQKINYLMQQNSHLKDKTALLELKIQQLFMQNKQYRQIIQQYQQNYLINNNQLQKQIQQLQKVVGKLMNQKKQISQRYQSHIIKLEGQLDAIKQKDNDNDAKKTSKLLQQYKYALQQSTKSECCSFKP